MPDISSCLDLLESTFFMYPSVEAAQSGTDYGGSGVVIAVPLESRPDISIRYALTNWHVAVRDGHSVIRLNKATGGGFYIIDKDPSEWTFISSGPDLAITELSLPDDVRPVAVPVSAFVNNENNDFHVGDDVFMVGRFIDYAGHETNHPSARFGVVSMKNVKVRQTTKFEGESVVVDLHSRDGFSGSPVYVYRQGPTEMLPWADFSKSPDAVKMEPKEVSTRKWGKGNGVRVRLLGLLWGQFPEKWEIGKHVEKPKAHASLITDGMYVTGFIGMSCVVPAEHIMRLLNVPKLKSARDVPYYRSASHIPKPMA